MIGEGSAPPCLKPSKGPHYHYWFPSHYLSQSSPTHVCAFILAPAVRATTPDAIDVVGCATPVKNLGRDSWGLIGTTVTLPNRVWGDDLVGDTLCTIDYFIGKHKFSDSTATAYTVSYEGDPSNYAMRADFIMRHLEPAKRKLLRKQQPEPRAVPG